MKFIILAGGSGARLWPLSRDLYPKPLLNLYDGQSLLQNVYKLALSVTEEKNIVTITNVRQLSDTKNQLHKMCKHPQIISEPISKNTATAIAAALFYLQGKRDETVVILPADFSVKSTKAFQEAIDEGIAAAKKGYIAALGVKPYAPEEGFGYIKIGKNEKNITPVIKFIEKPDLKTANEFFKSKDYYWNSGIYISKISTLIEEIHKYSPETLLNFSKDMFDEQNIIGYDYYEKLPEISIDNAVMEKTDKLAFVELKAKWKDYGSWHEIYNNSEKDNNGNVFEGNIIADNISNSLLFSSKELVAATSLKNTIVIDTEDVLLVCDKDKTSEIGNLVKEVEKQYNEAAQIRKTVVRPWGLYTCLNKGKGWLTKIITVSPMHKLSLQSHNYRSEHWVVLEGSATVVLEEKTITLEKGTSINIPVKARHSLQNLTDEPLKILEVQKGEYIDENDIIRYEDMYGRIS